ncbi:MAG TPA: hypothetical protein D7I06_04555 [Candidatus Poseidoniales archaeon]|nr:MAG TPA: hypothetical protein D7I06_04555 [Candidatus Poseidoniales archaeon]HII62856.1 hypothetical protein [Candidatus Poseidoniaceae archaeon]
MIGEEHRNPWLAFKEHLNALLRAIEPQLDSLFSRAIDGSLIETWTYNSIEEAADFVADLLIRLDNLPPFLNYSKEFKMDSEGEWI